MQDQINAKLKYSLCLIKQPAMPVRLDGVVLSLKKAQGQLFTFTFILTQLFQIIWLHVLVQLLATFFLYQSLLILVHRNTDFVKLTNVV
jgi:hypothetical protein